MLTINMNDQLQMFPDSVFFPAKIFSLPVQHPVCLTPALLNFFLVVFWHRQHF